MPSAASQPVAVARIPAAGTGPITVGPDGSTEEIARECQKRIENYRELQKNIEKTIADALDQAPWAQQQKK
jgi:hypothetical protein